MSDAESTSEDAASITTTAGPPAGMLHVPAGLFLFGRRKESVELSEFWIDEVPVTNADYLRFVEVHHRPNPRHWPPDGLSDDMLDLPVVNLTYAEAEAYAELTGCQLPTPAQYERAARGTDGSKYPWGDAVRGRVTNSRESGIGSLTPVRRFEAGRSAVGCYDLAGNVLHWTRAYYDEETGTRILKGTSFRDFLGAAAWNHEGDPTKRMPHVGLRRVWTKP